MALLDREPGVVVLRRCVDVPDLLAAATAGQADVAVVAVEAPGLDHAAADHLRRHHVRAVAVVPDGPAEAHRERAGHLGIVATIGEDALADLPGLLRAGEQVSAGDEALAPLAHDHAPSSPRGRVVTVWGPGGAPGRTTVAVAVAAELGSRGRRTTLVDADPYGGAVAQQLGVLDEVSGLLAAARLAAAGHLDARFATVQRGVGSHLTVVTGLPRPDRWVELRPGSVERLLEVAAAHGEVVVDSGFSVEPDAVSDVGARPSRNQATLAAIVQADDVVVVGSADPVGLSRLVRGLADLSEVAPGVVPWVVVNRMRPTLGWSEKDVVAMVDGFAPLAGMHFLPDDRAGVDRALVAGRTLVECGDSPLRRAVAGLVDALSPTSVASVRGAGRRAGRRVRRRTASTARRR